MLLEWCNDLNCDAQRLLTINLLMSIQRRLFYERYLEMLEIRGFRF